MESAKSGKEKCTRQLQPCSVSPNHINSRLDLEFASIWMFILSRRVDNQRRPDDSGASATHADGAVGQNDQQTEQRRPHVGRPGQHTLLWQFFGIFVDAVLRTCAEELLPT